MRQNACFLLIQHLCDVVMKNQLGASSASLSNFFKSQKTKMAAINNVIFYFYTHLCFSCT